MPALAADSEAAVPGAAPATAFAAIQESFTKDAASQDLVDRLYAFMEKYPKDPRADRVQYWVGLTQQKREFHHEAVKELGFVVSDFPSSPLVLPALMAQAGSYLAMADTDHAGECFSKIVAQRPKDFAADPATMAAYHDALVWLAHRAIKKEKPDYEAAVALLLQLPDQQEAVSRCVQIYIAAGKQEEALAAVHRLPDSQRFLGYHLILETYASRPGAANLHKLLDEVITKEKPSEQVDQLLRHITRSIAVKGADEHRKALETLSEKYERLRRAAQFGLCELDRDKGTDRLVKFIGDYHTGADVESAKTWIGEFYETVPQPDKAREAYRRLDDPVAAHFAVAQTYYGPRAKVKDYPAGQAELTSIVKHFYSPTASAEALSRRSDLEAGPLSKPDAAIATCRELIDRFPKEENHVGHACMQLAMLLRVQKKQDDAIKVYEKLATLYPQNALVRQAWLEIAACHEEKGDAPGAIDALKAVLHKYPRTHEASAAHTRLETKYKVDDVDVSDR